MNLTTDLAGIVRTTIGERRIRDSSQRARYDQGAEHEMKQSNRDCGKEHGGGMTESDTVVYAGSAPLGEVKTYSCLSELALHGEDYSTMVSRVSGCESLAS